VDNLNFFVNLVRKYFKQRKTKQSKADLETLKLAMGFCAKILPIFCIFIKSKSLTELRILFLIQTK